jgi:hypothetical protein
MEVACQHICTCLTRLCAMENEVVFVSSGHCFGRGAESMHTMRAGMGTQRQKVNEVCPLRPMALNFVCIKPP